MPARGAHHAIELAFIPSRALERLSTRASTLPSLARSAKHGSFDEHLVVWGSPPVWHQYEPIDRGTPFPPFSGVPVRSRSDKLAPVAHALQNAIEHVFRAFVRKSRINDLKQAVDAPIFCAHRIFPWIQYGDRIGSVDSFVDGPFGGSGNYLSRGRRNEAAEYCDQRTLHRVDARPEAYAWKATRAT
jgi:hypothetical protein